MKKWVLRIGLVILLLVSFWIVSNVMQIKSPHGINQTRAFYEQKRNTIDVLAVGSSHVHCGINTQRLWEEYGIAAYDFSAAEQPLWITYYYLQEAYKYQSPKVVVLDVFAPARFKEDYHYKWLEESVYGMRFSKTKLDMINVSIEPDRKKEYFPSFFTYHNRYVDMNKEDLFNIFGNHTAKRNSKGFTPGFIVADQSESFGGWDELEDYHLTDKSREYLYKIIELTREHGSELKLIAIPYNLDERDKITFDEIAEIAASEGISFTDYNECLDEIGIDKSVDFNDHTHLNYWGSEKFAHFLGKELLDGTGVIDRRGQSGYESWDAHVQEIASQVLNK